MADKVLHVEAVPVDPPDCPPSDHNGASASVHAAVTPPPPPPGSQFTVINEVGARQYLTNHTWPVGLQLTSIEQLKKIAIRYLICDDSGSMGTNDGHKMENDHQFTKCSRWQELGEGLRFHAGLAKVACAPTEFRLLNGSPPIWLGRNDEGEEHRYQSLMAILSQRPGGSTPLCRHIREVIEQIRLIEPQLRATGQKACVIIATDGESSDGDIVTAMQPLRNMQVWVVVRLCTDEDRIVEYWNNIDSQLEVDMDVLDDLQGEAKEVVENNRWLTYGEPLHRLREFGVLIKEIDMLDSNKLSLDQIHKFCSIIYGGTMDSYPHPELDFNGFVAAVERENRRTAKVWDPVKMCPRDWISVHKLRKPNPHGGCTVS